MRQKLSDVRGRGSVLYREWFFHNPISHLRECDGDRCEFWRFRFPGRREAALKGFIEQCMMRFPPKTPGPLIISSFGSGLLFQEFTNTCKLIQMGYRQIRLVLVDTAYAPWKQKYLSRDGSCRIYVQSASELHPDMLRPAPAYSAPGTTKEFLDNAASNVTARGHRTSWWRGRAYASVPLRLPRTSPARSPVRSPVRDRV